MSQQIINIIVEMKDLGYSFETIVRRVQEYDDSITEFEVEQIIENMY